MQIFLSLNTSDTFYVHPRLLSRMKIVTRHGYCNLTIADVTNEDLTGINKFINEHTSGGFIIVQDLEKELVMIQYLLNRYKFGIKYRGRTYTTIEEIVHHRSKTPVYTEDGVYC
jgi:hypothetical protein